jgi:hypothetical protein
MKHEWEQSVKESSHSLLVCKLMLALVPDYGYFGRLSDSSFSAFFFQPESIRLACYGIPFWLPVQSFLAIRSSLTKHSG